MVLPAFASPSGNVNFQLCGTFELAGALAAQLIDAIASEIANAQLPTWQLNAYSSLPSFDWKRY